MRFSCPNCQATFQTASGGAAPPRVACAGCGTEMIAALAEPLFPSGAQLSGGDSKTLHLDYSGGKLSVRLQ